MKFIFFLLLAIFFFGCTNKEKQKETVSERKEILSAELIYFTKIPMSINEFGKVDTVFTMKTDTIFIKQKDELKVLVDFFSNSSIATDVLVFPAKYHLIVHYKDSDKDKKYLLLNNYYKSIPDLEFYKSTKNIGPYCEELIAKYSKK